jgi:hypothetical protein
MVEWLAHPLEMRSPPDIIELKRVISGHRGPKQGIFDWYLFRFRTLEPHWGAKDGWLAGVAGPFRREDAPSPVSYGDTVSTFMKWDSLQPEQHVRVARGLTEMRR